MQEVLNQLGRTTFVVNLDPANDRLSYDCQLNIFELINIEDVMVNCELGPNGSLIYCMEFLEENMDWLVNGLQKLCSKPVKNQSGQSQPPYILFDLPGQVELYTHHKSVKNIIQKLTSLDYRLCCVNLVDSYYASDASKFISVLLMSLNTMLQIELPHVNILSKMDIVNRYGKLAFNLEYYTDVLDLKYLIDTLDNDRLFKRFKQLNNKICDVIQDYSLVSYVPLNIQKKQSLMRCINMIDRANGYVYGNMDDQDMFSSYAGDVGDQLDEEVLADGPEEDEEERFIKNYYSNLAFDRGVVERMEGDEQEMDE